MRLRAPRHATSLHQCQPNNCLSLHRPDKSKVTSCMCIGWTGQMCSRPTRGWGAGWGGGGIFSSYLTVFWYGVYCMWVFCKSGLCISSLVSTSLLLWLPVAQMNGWQDSSDTIFNFQHQVFPRCTEKVRGSVRERWTSTWEWNLLYNKQKHKQRKKNQASRREHKGREKKLQILFFLPTLSALFPRPEFCYIQPYICSPRLRRGCSWQLVKPPESPSLPLSSTQLAN